jgi:hypothetical protein
MWAALRDGIISFGGQLANIAGLPCFIREAEYRSRSLEITVRVRASHLYTVVTVNGIDVYFNRLSGTMDGIRVRRTEGSASGAVPVSARAAESV